MTDVVDRLAAAMNAHDLDAVAGLIHADYRSEQPAHPGRAFTAHVSEPGADRRAPQTRSAKRSSLCIGTEPRPSRRITMQIW